MEKLSIIIGNSINFIIGGLFLVTLVGFVFVLFRIARLQNQMNEDRKKSGGRKVFTGDGIKKEPDAITWEDTLTYMEDFNKIQLLYAIFEQFVPVFPLLGILGTVAGLIQQLGNLDQMMEALALSMSTTFWGLIAGIVLRVVDAIWVKKEIYKKELYFETYEQNYQMVKDKYIQENEK